MAYEGTDSTDKSLLGSDYMYKVDPSAQSDKIDKKNAFLRVKMCAFNVFKKKFVFLKKS